VGADFAHNSYDGRQPFLPAQIIGVAGYPLEQIQFAPPSTFSVDQNEISWFVGDKWTVSNRLTLNLLLRSDRDSVGFILALTGSVEFLSPLFRPLPLRTVSDCYKMHTRVASNGWIFRKNCKNRQEQQENYRFHVFSVSGNCEKQCIRFLRSTSRFETFSLLPFLGQSRVSSRKCKVLHEFPNWHSPCNENRVGAYSSSWAPIKSRLSKREGRSLAGSYRNQRSSD
jgi:hypothetical protein